VVTGQIITPAVGAVTLVGAAPSLHFGVIPGSGAIAAQGNLPVSNRTVLTVAGAATLAGAAPSAVPGQPAFPQTGAATFATNAPNIVQSAVVTPGTANVVIVTFAPKRQSPNWVVINDAQNPNWIPIAA
jgi:hypothetical protein